MKTKLRQIVANVLDVPTAQILPATSPRDFAQWDSAAHIDIILSIESEFAVSFSPEEMAETLSVGALEDALLRKGIPPQ